MDPVLAVQYWGLRDARAHAQIVAGYVSCNSASEARSPHADALAIHAGLILQPVDCAAKVLDFIHWIESVAGNSVAAAEMAIIDGEGHIARRGKPLALFDETGSGDAEAMADDKGRIRSAICLPPSLRVSAEMTP